MVFREIEWGCVDWMHLVQVRDQWRILLSTVNEPSGSITGGEFCDWLSDHFLLRKGSLLDVVG
jgi:hypothetical protein